MSKKAKKFFYYITVVVPLFDAITGFVKGCLSIITNPELVQQVKDQETALKQLKKQVQQFLKDQYND